MGPSRRARGRRNRRCRCSFPGVAARARPREAEVALAAGAEARGWVGAVPWAVAGHAVDLVARVARVVDLEAVATAAGLGVEAWVWVVTRAATRVEVALVDWAVVILERVVATAAATSEGLRVEVEKAAVGAPARRVAAETARVAAAAADCPVAMDHREAMWEAASPVGEARARAAWAAAREGSRAEAREGPRVMAASRAVEKAAARAAAARARVRARRSPWRTCCRSAGIRRTQW